MNLKSKYKKCFHGEISTEKDTRPNLINKTYMDKGKVKQTQYHSVLL